jgi:hypothetical protein
MQRLKVIGLALVAVFAISIVASATAMAADEVKPGTYTGKLVAGTKAVFEAGGTKEECEESTSTATVAAGTKVNTFIPATLSYGKCAPAAVNVTAKCGIEVKYLDGDTAGTEALGANDGLEYKIPAKCITFTILTCKIEVGPAGGTNVSTGLKGYNDETGFAKFTNAAVAFTGAGFGCPASPGTYNAEYGPIKNANTPPEILADTA